MDRGERFAVAGSFNVVAGVLTVFTAFSLGILSEKQLPRNFQVYAMFLMLGSLGITVLTLSRSGWIGIGIIFLLYCLLERKWSYLAVFFIISLPLLFISNLGERFLGDYQLVIDAYSSEIRDLLMVPGYQNLGLRLLMWSNVLDDLLTPRSIIIGAGAGMNVAWAKSNTNEAVILSEVVGVFIDLGLVGCLLLLLSFGVMFRQARITWRFDQNPLARAVGLAALLGIMAFIPRFLWDQVLNGFPGWLLLAFCGLAGGKSKETNLELGRITFKSITSYLGKKPLTNSKCCS